MDTIFLNDPSYLDLDDAYRGLPKLHEIITKTSNLQEVLKDMEKIGFVAIEIVDMPFDRDSWTIKASKGKHGPCRFDGNTAVYKGCALAALDDDLHLLPVSQNIRVCEKTMKVLSLPAYKNFIELKAKDQEAKAENENEDFDFILGDLYNLLKDLNPGNTNRKMLFYPGPFRSLILQDGTLVRRGKWNAVPSEYVDQLTGKEGFLHLEYSESEPPVFFQEMYIKEGPSTLMNELKLKKQNVPEFLTDLTALNSVSKPLKHRLLKLLDENKKYFVLVGSDLSDKLGCCPSEEVTEANNLVKKGILNAYSEPDQGESCPLTFYSIKDELTITDTGFKIKFDTTFRKQIRERLEQSPSNSQRLIKWILMAFIIISSLLAARRCYELQTITPAAAKFEQLQPLIDGQLQLVLFHNEKRCYQCLQMEEMSRFVIESLFSDDLKSGSVVFKTLTIDDPINQELVEQLGIFAAALVLFEFDGEELTYARILPKANELYRDDAAFKDNLTNELTEILKSNE